MEANCYYVVQDLVRLRTGSIPSKRLWPSAPFSQGEDLDKVLIKKVREGVVSYFTV